MLTSFYEKTKTWGPGSCMVAFYFFSLIPVAITVALNSYFNGFNLENVVPRNDIDLFVKSLFFAPWFETLLLNVLLTKIFMIMKVRPINIIFAVALIFSCMHFSNGWYHPLVIFIPALMFQWHYFLYVEKQESGWGFLSTTVLHFLYNFTIFVVIPLINIVLTIYYGGVGDTLK